MSQSRITTFDFHRRGRHAFTLLEISIVIMIIAVLAGLLITNFDSWVDSAEPTATQSSLAEIRDGFILYWRDVKHTGPIREAIENSITDASALLPVVQTRMLLDTDLDRDGVRGGDDGFLPFDPATQIGWRGPYVSGAVTRYFQPTDASDSGPEFTPAWGQSTDPYGRADDQTIRDRFIIERSLGRPIIIQAVPLVENARLVRIDVRVVSAGEDGVLQIPIVLPDGTPLLNRDLSQVPIGAPYRGDDLYVAFEVRP